MNLQGRVALVTGAGSGIGRSTAEQLLALCANVVVVDVDETAAMRVCDEWSGPGKPLAIGADVGDFASVAKLFSEVERRFATLDYLVNNAGVLGGPRFPDAAPDAWIRAVRVNLVGTLNCIQLAVPLLRQRGGAIVNVASTSGLTPNPVDPVYAATKAAVVNLTRSLAFMAVEDGIRVNTVCPALVRTPLERNSASSFSETDKKDFLARRAGRTAGPALDPEEVASQVVAFLVESQHAGMACRMIAGQIPELIAPPTPQKL